MVPDPEGEYGTDVPVVNCKPLRADARRNRAAVIAAAHEAFAATGLSVPMDDIARAAGVGVGTLYRHFPTKEALFAAVVRDHLERLRDEAISLADAADAGAAFFSFVERLVEEAVVKRDLLEALAEAGIDVSDGVADLKESFHAALERVFERAKAEGAVRGDLSAAEVMHLVMGACLAFCRNEEDEATRRRLLGVVFDGLRTKQGAAVPDEAAPGA